MAPAVQEILNLTSLVPKLKYLNNVDAGLVVIAPLAARDTV